MRERVGLFALIVSCCFAAPAGAQVVRGPTAALLQRAACAAALPDDQALLFGVVRDAELKPRGGVQVAALWTEVVVTTRTNETLLRAAVDTTAPDGSYALCGVPQLTLVALRADFATGGSGELQVDLGDATAVERDLRVGERLPAAVVLGRLVSPAGNPLGGTVEILGDSAPAARADSTGFFRLEGLPRRSSQLRVRVIGYVPQVLDIAPDGPLVEMGDVQLPNPIVALNRVLIEETFMSPARRGFEERRKVLNGRFLDEDYLGRLAYRTANNIKMASTMIRGSSGPTGDVFRLRYGVDDCYPLVFVDGVNIGRQGPPPNSSSRASVYPEQMRDLLQQAKRMEFFGASFAPAEYADTWGCGSMLIWTR